MPSHRKYHSKKTASPQSLDPKHEQYLLPTTYQNQSSSRVAPTCHASQDAQEMMWCYNGACHVGWRMRLILKKNWWLKYHFDSLGTKLSLGTNMAILPIFFNMFWKVVIKQSVDRFNLQSGPSSESIISPLTYMQCGACRNYVYFLWATGW